ncbi:MAG: histidine phosphatase family protein [Rhodoferax sp.]|uniref:histidine phosphatase family protein n=1 Tax=Rhodoferax sp. TaxID=50421 RepID=UPI0030168711
MNTAQLCLTRHGETDWNKRGILQGWLDVPLNEQGRKQAHELAQNRINTGFSAVWSSPLLRAQETAEIVARVLGLPPPCCHEGLKERHFGAIQGIPKSELAELNPALLEQILRRNPAAEFVGGESMEEFSDRLIAACTEIGSRHRGVRVLVVTHGWGLDVVTRHVSGLPRNAVLQVKPANGDSVWVEVSNRVLAAQRV